jgi:hypothetical protein
MATDGESRLARAAIQPDPTDMAETFRIKISG